MTSSDPQSTPRGGTLRIVAAILAVVALLGGVELYALWRSNHPEAPAVGTAAPSPALEAGGGIDVPAGDGLSWPKVALSGWALDPSGIKAVEIRVDGLAFAAQTGTARPDVAAVKPGYPDTARAGWEWTGDLTSHPAPPDVDRRIIEVVAVGKDGRETVIGRRSLIEGAAFQRWSDAGASDANPFHLLPALSGIALGGATGLDTEYAAYQSTTIRTGMRVPILYLRTTLGSAADYAFDPGWDIERRCGARRIAEDSLTKTLTWALDHKLPVLVTLNGGIWADASCDVPDWDANDKLEQDPANCQWNEQNQVMPDDALKHLPGSQDAPELGRSLTFNVYASRVRFYKQRNLQQAALPIAAFLRTHPELLVGVNLDPDTYLNPFFGEKQWYDYNPGTLRQFRHWLAGTGPYAGPTEPGVPDLSAYRRRKPLSLADVGKLAERPFRTWDEVDPPRRFPRDPERPFWKDPWVREWEVFRRHLVHLHYDELSQWLVELGLPKERIWSSQGFMAPAGEAMPFALAIDSPVKNYDSGGMSVEGAIPRSGHLGAIFYGPSAVNDIPMENGRKLFATFETLDPGFGVVEINTADLRDPKAMAPYASGYRALRDLWNAGTRFVSPMAWNGSNGRFAGQPGFVSYTAWRDTPFEDAARDFMLSHANLPVRSLLWTFGTPRHADGDGWTAEQGAIALGRGRLELAPDASGRIALLSPTGLALSPERIGRVVAGLPADAGLVGLHVYAKGAGNANWETVASARGDDIGRMNAGRFVRHTGQMRVGAIDQLKVELVFDGPGKLPLARIAVLPAP